MLICFYIKVEIDRLLNTININISTIDDRVFYASISNLNNILKKNDEIFFTILNEMILMKKNRICLYNFENIINNKLINDTLIIKNDKAINNNQTINDENLFKFSDNIF